jgi:hypothetical protein
LYPLLAVKKNSTATNHFLVAKWHYFFRTFIKAHMSKRNSNPEGGNKGSANYYDMTEEASKKSPQTGGTQELRQAESDDLNEEATQGPISTPSGDNWGENKVSTSLSDE